MRARDNETFNETTIPRLINRHGRIGVERGWKPRENYAVCLIYIPIHLELMYRRYYNDASKATNKGAHPPSSFLPKNWRRWCIGGCTSSRIKPYRLYWRSIDACSLPFFFFFFFIPGHANSRYKISCRRLIDMDQ